MTNDTMPERYARSVLKTVVAQICQMIGWHSINSTPFEFLVDLTQEYLVRISKVTQQYAQVLGRTEANLDDLGLAFRHMHVEVPELVRYVRNVDSVPCLVGVPKFPVHRENHLNFLKPGSQEVVTRPVHVHEYLPAMYPESEEHLSPVDKGEGFTDCRLDPSNGHSVDPGHGVDEEHGISDDGCFGGGPMAASTSLTAVSAVSATSSASSVASASVPISATLAATATTGGSACTVVDAAGGAAGTHVAPNSQGSPQSVFKRPGGPLPLEQTTLAKRSKMLEEGRPLREIHSVIMTTSGFLSPAREGKLPEARTPHAARADSPPPSSSYPMVPPEFKTEKKPEKKKTIKKGGDDRKLDKENKKKNRVKELFKPDNVSDVKPRKMGASVKQVTKTKPSAQASTHREISSKIPKTVAATSAVAAAASQSRVKPTITDKLVSSEGDRCTNAVPTAALALSELSEKRDTVDKLPSEPDKQKLNIFKKISKPREDKASAEATGTGEQSRYKQQQMLLDARESSPTHATDENSEKRLAKRSDDASTPVTTSATVGASASSDKAPRHEIKTPRTPEVEMDGRGAAVETPSSDALHHATSSPDVYMFDDMSPPGTPSTPKTPELNVTPHVDPKKRKKDRTSRKKEQRSKSPKPSVATKKLRVSLDAQESPIPFDRPKTPQALDSEQHHRETSSPASAAATVAAAATLPFPFFPPFPAAPGLIPHPLGHPMFQRYPLPLGRGTPHPAMPNLPIPPRFFASSIRGDDSLPGKVKHSEREKAAATANFSSDEPQPAYTEPDRFQKDTVEKSIKSSKSDKDVAHHAAAASLAAVQCNVASSTAPPAGGVTSIASVSAAVVASATSVNASTVAVSSVCAVSRSTTKNLRLDKIDKNNKKSKDHKRERKDKIKKKKDKKDKHKVKEKSKGKKGKLGKLKDKKEKKEKRKDKDKDDKSAEGVPKITLKLGPASPRPPTPDNTLLKKITIKPLIKKLDDEKKRDPSPELAKISALVTRPPKQKITKFKSDGSSRKGESTDDRENGKSLLAAAEPLPATAAANAAIAGGGAAAVDQAGRQVWICPACGNQDDGSPMIGCDDCDAWYHWVCVGVQVPPADHEDWYCRLCIAKKQELHHDKKRKKRKKKVKALA